jgi:hypothetical protein
LNEIKETFCLGLIRGLGFMLIFTLETIYSQFDKEVKNDEDKQSRYEAVILLLHHFFKCEKTYQLMNKDGWGGNGAGLLILHDFVQKDSINTLTKKGSDFTRKLLFANPFLIIYSIVIITINYLVL